MVDKLFNLALVGGEPILYILIGLSIISVGVAVERLIAYRKQSIDLAGFTSNMIKKVSSGDIDSALAAAQGSAAAPAQVAAEGLQNAEEGETVVAELMEAATTRQSQILDRYLIILGTVGSNAPFIGLLGTVLGIIKAFNDLAFNSEGGPSVVMAGIGEALVATAVGLLVAIPAVVAFNYFKNRQKVIMGNIEQIKKTLLALLSSNNSKDSEPERLAA